MQFNPFLKYSYKLNGDKIIGISLGPNVTEKAEESLDEGGFNLPINVRDIEYEMNGTLEIEVTDSRNTVKNFTFLIIYDKVDKISPYGWFTHSLRVVEYTNKTNNYFINSLIKTYPNSNKNVDARFEIPNSGYLRHGHPEDDPTIHSIINNSYRVVMPYIKITEIMNKNNNGDLFFESIGTNVSYISIEREMIGGNDIPSQIKSTGAFLMLDNDPLTKQNISSGDVTFTDVSNGVHRIQYGLLNVPDLRNEYAGGVVDYPKTDMVIYDFIVNVYPSRQITLYDVIQKLRNIKPFETKEYHEQTRIFDIDDTIKVNGFTLKEVLEKTNAPQFFIQDATMFQVLSGIFKYINSIPRLLRNGDFVDKLSRDDFNEIVGQFTTSGMYDYTSSQDVQLYGTRGISPLQRTLPNNLDKPNIESPANNFFKTIRATDVQLTMNNNGWYIPLEEEVYMINKLEVKLPIDITLYQTKMRSETTLGTETVGVLTKPIFDITSRTIDKRLWNLKDNQNYFPSIKYIEFFEKDIGLRNNKSGNIYWEQGENGLRISDYFGELIKNELLENVVLEAIQEDFAYKRRSMFSLAIENQNDIRARMLQSITHIDELDIKNLKFNIEYITLKDFNVSQEREDRSIIRRFSELSLKQSDKQINVELASRKSYGELQRGALPNYSFSKVHNYLDDIIPLFTVDEEGYTIVERSITFYNTYIDVVYVATKDHNRLQEFIGVNQEYRAWEIPTSNKIYDRKEYYTDYVFIIPSEKKSNLIVTKSLLSKKFYRQLVANIQNDKTYNKVSFGLVYTDGFGEEYADIEPNNNFRLMVVPAIVVGVKQSLIFTIGFNDNQLAGNSLVVENGNTYNKAVRYTDFKGELNEMWLALFNNIEDTYPIIDKDTYDYNEYPLTPEIAFDNPEFATIMENGIMSNGTLMRSTPIYSEGEYNPFIVDKDSHENITVQYNVSVMGYNYGQFVVGQRFTSFNSLVNNDLDDLYIYLYNTKKIKYGIFNDQYIINLNDTTRVLLSSLNVSTTDIDNGTKLFGITVSFLEPLLSQVRGSYNWAIGDANGNLYLACNDNTDSFDFIGTHLDYRVTEIGKKQEIVIINSETLYFELTTHFGTSLLIGESNQEVFDNLTMNTIFNTSLDKGNSDETPLDLGQLVTKFEVDLISIDLQNLGFNLTTSFENGLEIVYFNETMSDSINTNFQTELYKQNNVPIATFGIVTSFENDIEKQNVLAYGSLNANTLFNASLQKNTLKETLGLEVNTRFNTSFIVS